MNKRIFLLGTVLAVGCGLFIAGSLVAEEKAAAPAAAPATAPAPAPAAVDQVIIDDQFNTDGTLGDWTGMNNVEAARDVKGGYLTLSNDNKTMKDNADIATHVNIQNTEPDTGNIALEVKFDDFATNDNCRFEINLSAVSSPGNAVVINRISAGKSQRLEFQAVGDGASKIAKSVPYPDTTGVLKLQVTGKTGEIKGFYKAKPEDQYTEMPGSPYTLEAFKSAPYTAVIMCVNWAEGGPASVKIDWAKVIGPANK